MQHSVNNKEKPAGFSIRQDMTGNYCPAPIHIDSSTILPTETESSNKFNLPVLQQFTKWHTVPHTFKRAHNNYHVKCLQN